MVTLVQTVRESEATAGGGLENLPRQHQHTAQHDDLWTHGQEGLLGALAEVHEEIQFQITRPTLHFGIMFVVLREHTRWLHKAFPDTPAATVATLFHSCFDQQPSGHENKFARLLEFRWGAEMLRFAQMGASDSSDNGKTRLQATIGPQR